MTPAELADLHAAAFTQGRPWSSDEFVFLLRDAHTHLVTVPSGFALWREIAGEAELLTIAVAPSKQGQGIGRTLMRMWTAQATRDCDTAFLEVAEDNAPARALYTACGFERVATRDGYYNRADGAVDALVMRSALR